MNTYQLLDKNGSVLTDNQFDSDREAVAWAREVVLGMSGMITLARVYPWGGCVRLMTYRRS